MDVEPISATPKRPRAKAATKDVAVAKPKRKTLATNRKTPAPEATTVAISPLDLNDMIATAAFYLAADRGFAPGRELDDWLEAERRVLALTTG